MTSYGARVEHLADTLELELRKSEYNDIDVLDMLIMWAQADAELGVLFTRHIRDYLAKHYTQETPYVDAVVYAYRTFLTGRGEDNYGHDPFGGDVTRAHEFVAMLLHRIRGGDEQNPGAAIVHSLFGARG